MPNTSSTSRRNRYAHRHTNTQEEKTAKKSQTKRIDRRHRTERCQKLKTTCVTLEGRWDWARPHPAQKPAAEHAMETSPPNNQHVTPAKAAILQTRRLDVTSGAYRSVPQAVETASHAIRNAGRDFLSSGHESRCVRRVRCVTIRWPIKMPRRRALSRRDVNRRRPAWLAALLRPISSRSLPCREKGRARHLQVTSHTSVSP